MSARIEKERIITADQVAELLGFETGRPRTLPSRTEYHKMVTIEQIINHLGYYSDDEVHFFRCSFAARYMPQLVAVALNPPVPEEAEYRDRYHLYNAYILVLMILESNTYFAKYFLSEQAAAAPGNKLAAYLAEHLVVQGQRYRRELEASRPDGDQVNIAVVAASEVLSVILSLQQGKPGVVPVPEPTKSALARIQTGWIRLFPERALFLRLTAGVLRGEMTWTYEAHLVRGRVEGMQTCDRSGCSAKFELLQCSRCMTAVYCDRQHQRDHWFDAKAPHKAVCFQTSY